MKLSCTFYPRSSIKSKIGGKILSLRPKNECVALIAFKLFAALNTLENEEHDLSTSLIRKDNLIDWPLKHHLSTDS